MGKIQKCKKCGVVHFSTRHKCQKKGQIDNKWLVRGDVKVRSVGDAFASK